MLDQMYILHMRCRQTQTTLQSISHVNILVYISIIISIVIIVNNSLFLRHVQYFADCRWIIFEHK